MTDLRIDARLSYAFEAPCDLLLQVEVARTPGQRVVEDALWTTPVAEFRRIAAEAGVGTRAWMEANGQFDATYTATVEVTRDAPELEIFEATPVRGLDADVTPFLMPSRYCPSEDFEAVLMDDFAGLAGGGLIAAVRDWIETHFTYDPEGSTVATTARDTFLSRRGVCRDYAHVLIAFARASGIPARMASVYAPGVEPPDFHAAAEVWLDGGWHLVDATGMARPGEMAVIGVGRDAAEVSFLTSFGFATFLSQEVRVTEGPPG
ncbi:transglutaminase-like domain-containing protein [Jannaschia marina]|uniref:transglutaminase-like domain-containing protein n=1 Tax=Jannaschia marina TaxID=2741674 RepID=UPI0015C8D348|nr:transglutaminase family protein [Jannaschia marina]